MSQTTSPITSEFPTLQGETNFGSDDISDTYTLKKSYNFQVTDSDEPGTVVLTIPLSTDIESQTTDLAKQYERYSINGLSINIAPYAPMGSTSGSVQICHTPDPNNRFGTDLILNLNKAVRQAGSIIQRPRSTDQMHPIVEGTCYCKKGLDDRYSSFGNIDVVVRDQPTVGDVVRTTITVECTYQFYQTTINTDAASVRDVVAATIVEFKQDQPVFRLPDLQLPNKLNIHLNRRIQFLGTLNRVNPATRIFTPKTLVLERIAPQRFVATKGLNFDIGKYVNLSTPSLNIPFAAELTYLLHGY